MTTADQINTKRPTAAEIEEIAAIDIDLTDLENRRAAILKKYDRCFECGAFDGDLHESGCDMEVCATCGNQINDTGARGCKCADPLIMKFEAGERF